jgi:hypothetical protein
MADPCHDPSEGYLFVLSPHWQQPCSDPTYFLYDAALSFEEIDGFAAHLFDRGVPTARPGSVSMPYSSDNLPPLVRVLDFFKSFSDPWSYEYILIIHQDLYPAHPVNAELSDSNYDGPDDPTGDDDGGQGAPSAGLIVPNLIGSGMVEQVRPSAVDQLTTAAPLGSDQPKKKCNVLVSKCPPIRWQLNSFHIMYPEVLWV